ncbi:MAG: cobalt ABC transporter ATP-binding protein [Ilumatobacter coccineus]|uniref:Cobalt ABC transporter ATP-binding protein n=1 Tax=Ilumatobacter coccineus TaxID=467094 RepID=A0A2G6K8W8_9ACTN|nr:MAG: cobalt ABC transporter ATP-binding protein [Ilumatobacter coccineus]
MIAAGLTATDVSFRYPNGPLVLDGFSLSIKSGERVALLGPNGAGKTTFALQINGLLAIQAGRIEVDGLPVVDQHVREIRTMVGSVFQDPDDQLFMQTVREDVAFGPANLGIDGAERDQRVSQALADVGASHLADRTSHHLSGGEKRRAALATVLSMSPRLLVLDEPTAGLDPVGRRELGDLLTTLPQTQLIITHELPFALATCERSVIVDHGRVVADAPTADLLADADLLAAHRLEFPFGYRSR